MLSIFIYAIIIIHLCLALRCRWILSMAFLPKSVGRRPPKASAVLTNYLMQSGEPPWTSYFVKYNSVIDDQRGRSHFNWTAGNSNYHVLRTGCFPYIKYHCTKRPYENLEFQDRLFYFIKLINLGEQQTAFPKTRSVVNIIGKPENIINLCGGGLNLFSFCLDSRIMFLLGRQTFFPLHTECWIHGGK